MEKCFFSQKTQLFAIFEAQKLTNQQHKRRLECLQKKLKKSEKKFAKDLTNGQKCCILQVKLKTTKGKRNAIHKIFFRRKNICRSEF